MFTQFVEAALNIQCPDGYTMRWFKGPGWSPARRHTTAVEAALAWGADLLVILGSDQVYDEDVICRLVARFEACGEIIAALVPSRGYVGWQEMAPFQRMAWRIKRSGRVTLEEANALVGQLNDIEVIDPGAGDMQRIDFIGSGCVLFHRDHLLAMKRPWFSEQFNPETYERLASMDTRWIWNMAQASGAQAWVDTTIRIRHLHIFPIDETYSARFTDWAHPGVGDPAICVFDPDAPAGAVGS